MTFMEAIKAMQDGKICFRKEYPDTLFRINKEENALLSKEKGGDWYLEELGLSDYLAVDWDVCCKNYVKKASVDDVLLDSSESLLMIVIEDLGENYRVITENGIVDYLDKTGDIEPVNYLDKEELEACYYIKVGTSTLVKDAMKFLDKINKEIENK